MFGVGHAIALNDDVGGALDLVERGAVPVVAGGTEEPEACHSALPLSRLSIQNAANSAVSPTDCAELQILIETEQLRATDDTGQATLHTKSNSTGTPGPGRHGVPGRETRASEMGRSLFRGYVNGAPARSSGAEIRAPGCETRGSSAFFNRPVEEGGWENLPALPTPSRPAGMTNRDSLRHSVTAAYGARNERPRHGFADRAGV
ncbi:hypothetical protein GCM10010231_58850 [Streptomyces sindenensis]|nr:hypothetical protein GCM10010231_58850 [Streptomyces sindenensis]